MPARLNPHDNGLCRSPRLRELKEKEESRKRLATPPTSKGVSLATKVAFGLFSMFALSTNIRMPKHRTNPDPSYAEQVLNRFHEVNELYDGSLNQVHHLMYLTDITTNKCFTFRDAMKEADRLSFVDAMEKEISDHENGNHWSVVHRNTLPNKARPIKAIWSFKRKRKPDGELLKHKACLCAHVGMQ